jgi:predicted acetyltransferase
MDLFRVRVAREDDLERLVEIHACAYPDGGGYDHHERRFTHPSFGSLANFRVIESGSRVVGHAALYPLDVWVGGKRVPTGGIASLAVAPEARGQGAAHALLEHLDREIEGESALALLYPFRENFYRDLGYATTAPFLSLRASVASLAAAFDTHRDELARFVPCAIEGPRLEQVKVVYDECAQRSSGCIARTEARWMRLFARESRHWIGVAQGDRLEAYASMSYDAPVTNGRQSLIVHELMARSEPARHAVIAAIGRQRDQVEDVELAVPYGDSLPFALFDAAGSRRGGALTAHPLGTLTAGPMVRIVDLGRALESRGYPCDGELTVRAIDPIRPETMRVASFNGQVETEPSTSVPDIEVPRATLGSMVIGGIRPSEAAALGLLRGHATALRLADELFSGPRFRCLDPF